MPSASNARPQRLCVMCKHFYNEPSYEYSEYTAGGGYFGCRKDHSEAHFSPDDAAAEVRQAMRFAEKCPDYDDAE